MDNRNQIDEIKAKLDIVTIAQEYLPSMKHSGRNFFALCPFHSEKSPSFSINPEMQRYKCFGCNESGDVINLIEKMEGVDFREALQIAAKRAGVTLTNVAKKRDPKINDREKLLLNANKLAADFYHYVLMKHENGAEGRSYARKRKFEKEQLEKFQIGFAPSGFDNLKKYLIKKGFNERDLVDFSLLTEKNGHSYDKFRRRLMFPVFNQSGEVIGFSGRVINKDDIPKYLNSSETLLYKKSQILYGIYQAKEAIRREKFAILVEGNVDVPMAHKFGIENVVAPMGTALTADQLKLLKRYCEYVYFAFDSDLAGEKALARGYALTQEAGLKSKAIDLGKFGDLDDLMQADSSKLKTVIEMASDTVEHLLHRFEARCNMNSAEGKSEFVDLAIDLIKATRDEIKQSHYITEVAATARVDESIVVNRFNNKNFKPTNPEVKTEKTNMNVINREESLLAYLLQYKFLRKEIDEFNFIQNRELLENYKRILELQSKENNRDANTIGELEIKLMMWDLGEFESDHEIKLSFDKLRNSLEEEYLKIQILELKQKIHQKEITGEDLTNEITELQGLTKKLKMTNNAQLL